MKSDLKFFHPLWKFQGQRKIRTVSKVNQSLQKQVSLSGTPQDYRGKAEA